MTKLPGWIPDPNNPRPAFCLVTHSCNSFHSGGLAVHAADVLSWIMRFPRASGILLHPTSLPGPHGIGDFGTEAYRLLDFPSAAGHKLWQVLPLNPTGYGDSPFQCFSASAGNPVLINLDALVEKGVLSKSDLNITPAVPDDTVDYGRVSAFKLPLLKRAAKQFFDSADSSEHQHFDKFCQENGHWLDDFALFMACKEAHAFIAWPRWPSDIAERTPAALQQRSLRLAQEIQ